MKIFFDEQGRVVGWVEGANQDAEQGISVAGTSEVEATPDIASAIADPDVNTPLASLQVVDGEAVLVDPPKEDPGPTGLSDSDNT